MLLQPSHSGVETREEILNAAFPHDLHPHVIIHSMEEALQMYPAALAWKEQPHGPGPREVHLAATHFMQIYKHYNFAWVTENDLRYTGRWGYFLNAAMHASLQAEKVRTIAFWAELARSPLGGIVRTIDDHHDHDHGHGLMKR